MWQGTPSRVGTERQRLAVEFAPNDLKHLSRGSSAQPPATRQEGSKEDVGKLWVLRHQATQLLRGYAMHASSLNHPPGQIGGLPAQNAELTDESTRPESDQRRLGGIDRRRPHDLDRALVDDDQLVGRIARRERRLACVELVGGAVRA
jgi:hypothetical protein